MSTLRDNLIAWYECNEASSTDAFDDAHTGGLDLAQTNSPGTTSGGRTFVAASSQRATSTDAAFDFGTGDFTAAIRISFSSLAANREIFGKGQTSSSPGTAMKGWRLLALSTGAIRAFFGDASSRITTDSSTGVVTTSGAYTLIYRADRDGNHSLFVNNSSVLSASIASQSGTIDTAAAFALGTFSTDSGGFGNYLSGTIFQAALWNRLLTTDEATELYNGGTELAYSATAPASGSPWHYNRLLMGS